ncbi:M28 family peptidase [Sporosarcina sp. YIM B06819]|uniref:M28 family peptidase n=1 Tax=Sporosarcina sp. YIM B06819 TaxID=3081769 RepID=UPI00298C335B|nr:M28 family peptidase [Sporosarcina sp. YIM B06819]
MLHKKGFVSWLFVISILLTACAPKTQVVDGPGLATIQSDLVNQLDVEKIYATAEELTKEPRVAGTESEKQAAAYLIKELENYGYDVGVQPFTFERYVMPEKTDLQLAGFEGTFTPAPFHYSVSGTVTGELINAGHGLKEDYDKIDAQGKIAVVTVERTYFYELVLHASKAGATAILIHFPEDNPIDTWTLGKHSDDYIPALALSHKDYMKISKNMDKKATVTIEGARVDQSESQNIMVTKQPDAEQDASTDIVIIGAHYDSVDQAPGASDNASGTSVVLELARMFKDVTTTKELRILFFGAEEEGLYGSKKYVSAMTEDEIKRSVAMFNLDMVGSADAGELAIQTVDGMNNAVTIPASQAYEALNGDSLSTDFGGRSDHVPFHEAGIDAALLVYSPLEKWYHRPEDTIDKLSKDRLLQVAKIVAASTLEMTLPTDSKE